MEKIFVQNIIHYAQKKIVEKQENDFKKGDNMAFQSIVEDSRKMNAKMIAMGQSIDIQKMPRPKAGTITKQKNTYTPEGTDIEKMLYPKNFKPREYEPEQTTINKGITEEIKEQAKQPQSIIGDEEIEPETIIQQVTEENPKPVYEPTWKRCKHYKVQGERDFCKEYHCWCVKEKCPRPEC
jgi:hypothetical protein